MAQDATGSPQTAEGASNRITARGLLARLALVTVCGAGLLSVTLSVANPDLEWRTLAMAAVAFAMGPFAAELTCRQPKSSVRLPLLHSVLFASSLALGPVDAALPGAFGGIARLLSAGRPNRPVYQILYIIFKPAAVCSGASLAFITAGGNTLMPQQVGSFGPLICAALAYVFANAALLGVTEETHGRQPATGRRATEVLAGWSLCLMGGCILAVLYALAPPHVLLAPALAISVAWLAVREPAEEEQAVSESPSQEQTASNGQVEFVDPVTGLANSRYLDMFLQREVSRSARTGSPLSVAIFDVDEFSKLIIRAGAKPAEDAFIKLGQQLKAGLRPYDLVARYSAGRLAVVLPETPPQVAVEVAERLHEALPTLIVKRRSLSVSVGVATFPEHASTAEELINSAHHALNRGKFEGPNRVYSCHNLPKAS